MSNVCHNNRNDNRILNYYDIYKLIIMSVLSFALMYVSYRNSISIFIQLGIFALSWIINIKRPVYYPITYLMFSILPSRVAYTLNENDIPFYMLNSKISVLFSVAFLVSSIAFGCIQNLKNKWIPIAFAVFMAISIFWANGHDYYSWDFALMCMIYIVVPLFINDKYDLSLICMSFCFSGIIYAIRILPSVFSLGSVYELGGVINRNYASLFLVMTVICSFLVIISNTKGEKWLRFLCWINILTASFLIISFASRSGFIILAILLCYFVLLNISKIHIRQIVVFSALLIVGVFIIHRYSFATFLIQRFNQQDIYSGNNRVDIQMGFLKMFSNSTIFRALFGNGFENARVDELLPHNSFIDVLISFGIIGLILFIIYMIKPIFALAKTKYSYLLIAIFVIFVHSFSIEPFKTEECIIITSMIFAAIGFPDAKKARKRL